MICPLCRGRAVLPTGTGHTDEHGSRVFDSRVTRDAVRRRRVCGSCGGRFTTYERHEPEDDPLDLELLDRTIRLLTRVIARRNRNYNLTAK